MNLILLITLLIKTFSFSITSDYSGFLNENDSKEINITYSCNNETDNKIEYNISFFNNSDINNSVLCKEKLLCSSEENKIFTCNFTEFGTFSLIIKNNETNKITVYKNLITIYNNNITVTDEINSNCFIFNNNITNKKLLNIKFDQIINKSLLNFNLVNGNKTIKAIPYEINNTFTVLGVENEIFYKDSIYNLSIIALNNSINFSNVLNFSKVSDSNETEYPFIEDFLNGKKTLKKLETNYPYDNDSKLRIKFSYFNKNRIDYFDIPPKIIYPIVEENIQYDENNNDNDEKYKNTYKFTLNTSSMTGQIILEYQYCGNYTVNYTDIYIEEDIEKKYGLNASFIFKNYIILLSIIIILFL